MMRTERAAAGGKALTTKVSPLYFERIGRIGGRRTKRNKLVAFANNLVEKEPERVAIWYRQNLFVYPHKRSFDMGIPPTKS